MPRLTPLFILLVAISVQVQPAVATNYAVGSCLPSLPSFTKISQAVAGVPPGSTIMVCPGNYPEQVTITRSLTLKGVVSGNAANPAITVPSGGVVQNVTNGNGVGAAAQILVKNPSTVNIANIAVDGTGSGVSGSFGGCPTSLMGIYYQNASGTVNHVAVRNQFAAGCGYGVFVENISGVSQSVKVQNSVLRNFDVGIYDQQWAGTAPHLTIVSNSIGFATKEPLGAAQSSAGILLFSSPATISGNIVTDVNVGIAVFDGTFSVTNNTIQATDVAIRLFFNEASAVSSNSLFGNKTGLDLLSTNNSVLQSNTISNSSSSPRSSSSLGVGVNVNCDGTGTNNTITSNTFNDVGTALKNIPVTAGYIIIPNLYFNVTTVKTVATTCSAG
jgi:Periplasmic copper-binding protein (NosD)